MIEVPIRFAPPVKRYAPVGRCIYCGRRAAKLGDEHIVPRAIGENSLVLPKACCVKRCGPMTNTFEGPVLGQFLKLFRTQLGMKSRHRQAVVDKVPLPIAEKRGDGEIAPVGALTVPLAELPLHFVTVRLRPPGIISEKARDPITLDGNLYFIGADGLQPILPKDQMLQVGVINPSLYCRMLAKIAYCYAVAELGYGSFEPIILDVIKGRDQAVTHLVGGQWDIPPPPEDDIMHELAIARVSIGGVLHIAVRIRLFSVFSSPEYLIVVGREREGVMVGPSVGVVLRAESIG